MLEDNIFLNYPEFIDRDPRTQRPSSYFGMYSITPEFQQLKHSTALPPHLLSGAAILDLGCCTAATGAWALHHGAARYVGVELQAQLAQTSRENLEKRFPKHDWQILQESFRSFFDRNTEKFDIVVLWGVLYHGIQLESFLKNIANLDPEWISIESIHPNVIQKLLKKHRIHQAGLVAELNDLPLIEYNTAQNMASELPRHKISLLAAVPSRSATQLLLRQHHYELEQDFTARLTEQLNQQYRNRYCLLFRKSTQSITVPDFENCYQNPDLHPPTEWFQYTNPVSAGEWRFDARVAEQFETHARRHIPRYDEIIDQSVQLCRKLCHPHSRIIDVGAATGETIRRLTAAGFHNLVGVESSNDMLNRARSTAAAEWVLSDRFPTALGPYAAVCCNWTLHFVQHKLEYLSNIYHSLESGGILILTEKTANSGVELELYHDHKRRQGVTESEIQAKAQSLQNVMFIDSVEWYMQTLKQLGFAVSIINADYCFTTFLARK